MTETGNWLHTSEQEDVLVSLRHAAQCVQAAASDPHMWKWAIIAFHSALQGALACYLTGTMGLGGLKRDPAKAMLKRLQEDWDDSSPYPKESLAPIGVLWDRATTGKQAGKLFTSDRSFEVIPVGAATQLAFKQIIDIRNDFMHFTPKGWSIEVSGLPKIFSRLASVITAIEKDGWAFRHLDEEYRIELIDLLTALGADQSCPKD